MIFSQWLESTTNELLNKTIKAFPNTTKRQHATNTIKITHMEWIPFLGMKTLYIKGLAQNEGKEYNPIILFKNVVYFEGGIPLAANDGKVYNVQPLSLDKNDVILRCQCGDFQWRWQHYDHLDHSLYGKNRKKYEGKGLWKANPTESAGMCKHLIKLIKVIQESGIIAEN